MRLFLDWAYSLVAGALVAVVIDTLAPKGKLGNGVKLITVLFLLVAAASPLLSLRGTGLSVPASASQSAAMRSVEEELREQMLSLAGDRIRERLTLTLEGKFGEGIRVGAVETELDDAGNILVKGVALTLPKSAEGKSEDILGVLREEFSKEVRISMEVQE